MASQSDEQNRIAEEIASPDKAGDPFVAAVRSTRMPMVITDPKLPDNPIVLVNDAFCKLTGYEREEIVGRNCRFLQGPATRAEDVNRVRSAIAQRTPIEIELLNYTKSGEPFWNRLLIAPVFRPDGELNYFFASQLDITLEKENVLRLQHARSALEAEVERRRVELSQSEQRLRYVLAAGRLGSWSLDLASYALTTSEICKANFGRDGTEEFSYADLVSSIHPGDAGRMHDSVQASIASGRDYDIEYRIVTPKGQVQWVQIRGQPFYSAEGLPLAMVGVSMDITERKRAEDHRALLSAELNHRVKNTLTTVQSIVHQTLGDATSIPAARNALQGRIQALAAAHNVLTRDSWDGATLDALVELALKPFHSETGGRLNRSGPLIRLPPATALAFSLALHELATNAMKFGALSNDAGNVVMQWDIHNGIQPQRLWFRWEEVGGPIVTPPSRTGFGSKLIVRVLAEHLDGDAKMDYRPSGLVFTVEAPLPDFTKTDATGMLGEAEPYVI